MEREIRRGAHNIHTIKECDIRTSIMLFSIMILVHITSQYKTKFSMDGCLFWGV